MKMQLNINKVLVKKKNYLTTHQNSVGIIKEVNDLKIIYVYHNIALKLNYSCQK